MLRREVLDQQFRGMKQALQDPAGSESRQALKDMMGDLNALLEKHQRGEDTTADFADFMDKHGEFFPEKPETLEELLDQLARQAAAMQRMLESMSPEQRQELSELMEQALSDLDLASEMGRLNDNLRSMRPDLPWSGRQRLRGDEPLGLGDATEALADLADLDALSEALSQDYAGASLEDVDEEAVARALGRQAVDDLARLREIERELERQGYLTKPAARSSSPPRPSAASGRPRCAGCSRRSRPAAAATTTCTTPVPPASSPARRASGASATSSRSTS